MLLMPMNSRPSNNATANTLPSLSMTLSAALAWAMPTDTTVAAMIVATTKPALAIREAMAMAPRSWPRLRSAGAVKPEPSSEVVMTCLQLQRGNQLSDLVGITPETGIGSARLRQSRNGTAAFSWLLWLIKG